MQTTFIFQRNLHPSMVTLLSARIMSSTRCNVAGVVIFTGRPTRCRPVEIAMSALLRTYAPSYGLLDVTGNAHRTWAAFLWGYPLLPCLLPTKTAQRHAVLSWYTYSGAPPSCNSCTVFTVMRIQIIARHNKTR
jgi:hypothetical protein